MRLSGLIFVVEDDPVTAIVTELFVKRNEEWSGEVQHFSDGQHAFDHLLLALAQQGPLPDLILLDLNMPFMDGWDFLNAYAGLAGAPKIPVFLLTSSIRPQDMERSRTYDSVKGYFSKPLDDAKVAQMARLLDADCAPTGKTP